jgi:hypothetical protein
MARLDFAHMGQAWVGIFGPTVRLGRARAADFCILLQARPDGILLTSAGLGLKYLARQLSLGRIFLSQPFCWPGLQKWPGIDGSGNATSNNGMPASK